MPHPVDIGFEIAGLEIERDDLKRTMRFAQWVLICSMICIVALGPTWAGYLSKDGSISVGVGMVVLVGILEKLDRHRLASIHDRIIDLRLKEQEAEAVPARVFGDDYTHGERVQARSAST